MKLRKEPCSRSISLFCFCGFPRALIPQFRYSRSTKVAKSLFIFLGICPKNSVEREGMRIFLYPWCKSVCWTVLGSALVDWLIDWLIVSFIFFSDIFEFFAMCGREKGRDKKNASIEHLQFMPAASSSEYRRTPAGHLGSDCVRLPSLD